MKKKEIMKKIGKEKIKLKEYSVKKIGLFGSFVKNKQNKKSDVDILVTFNKIDFNNYMNTLFLLEKLFKRKVDLVIEEDLREELSHVKKEVEYVKL